jgi:hypothetical protein
MDHVQCFPLQFLIQHERSESAAERRLTNRFVPFVAFGQTKGVTR